MQVCGFLESSEEYCHLASRRLSGRQRGPVDIRSWELHLLLSKAVLVRRRKRVETTEHLDCSEEAVSSPALTDSALVENAPWQATLINNLAALVLPPCTRIVQLLHLPETSAVSKALAKGLLLEDFQLHRDEQSFDSHSFQSDDEFCKTDKPLKQVSLASGPGDPTLLDRLGRQFPGSRVSFRVELELPGVRLVRAERVWRRRQELFDITETGPPEDCG